MRLQVEVPPIAGKHFSQPVNRVHDAPRGDVGRTTDRCLSAYGDAGGTTLLCRLKGLLAGVIREDTAAVDQRNELGRRRGTLEPSSGGRLIRRDAQGRRVGTVEKAVRPCDVPPS
jgi:hypothetical protein